MLKSRINSFCLQPEIWAPTNKKYFFFFKQAEWTDHQIGILHMAHCLAINSTVLGNYAASAVRWWLLFYFLETTAMQTIIVKKTWAENLNLNEWNASQTQIDTGECSAVLKWLMRRGTGNGSSASKKISEVHVMMPPTNCNCPDSILTVHH